MRLAYSQVAVDPRALNDTAVISLKSTLGVLFSFVATRVAVRAHHV